jgi:putative membrane protein
MSSKLLVAVFSTALLASAPTLLHAQDKAAKEQGAAKKSSGQLAKDDLQSFRRMAQADMAEVAAGKVAAQKAQSPEVKKYGQHMVDEHSKMLEEGKQLAQAKGVTPPSQPRCRSCKRRRAATSTASTCSRW